MSARSPRRSVTLPALAFSGLALTGLALAGLTGMAAPEARAQGMAASTPGIVADGSSTVHPITGEAARRTRTEVSNGFSGTRAGFRRFCAGETDISNASRPINEEELKACEAAGVAFVELPIAFDAIAVVVHPSNDWATAITTAELRRLWEPAAEGAVTTWRDLRADWPDRPIKLYGRGRDSGTYDYFTATIVGAGGASRADYTASEDEEALAAGIAGDPDALGFFGVGAYFRHWEELKDLAVDSGDGPVHPGLRDVLAGSYQPLARPLFLYVNAASLEAKPELQAFLKAYLSGMRSWVHFTGYMPLSVNAYQRAQLRLEARTTGTRFSGQLQIGIGIDQLYD